MTAAERDIWSQVERFHKLLQSARTMSARYKQIVLEFSGKQKWFTIEITEHEQYLISLQ